DEAHCISEWGHDFRPEYRRIREIIDTISRRPIIALTATATPKVQHDIRKNLGINSGVVYKSSFNRANLFYEVRPKTKDVMRDIIRYIKSNPGKSGIIYCLSRKSVEDFTQILHINNIKAHPYHAGMDAARRAANQDDFLQEKVDVIVATIAFGMGIDKPDVRYVIHYDIPKSLEGYYQETGRAGRDGGEGRCITFYSHKDLQKLDKLMQGKSPGEQEICRQLLMETARYAESSVCRRRILLNYFGEHMEECNCGNCDNCITPTKRVEASEELSIVLESIKALGEKYKSEYIVAFLTGSITGEMQRCHQDDHELFGALSDVEDGFLNNLIQQAVISGYLHKEMENYGILHLTKAGMDYMEHPVKFMMIEMKDFGDTDYESGGEYGSAADNELFSILKDVRRHIASRLNVPPYVILQDSVLESMATTYPVTEEEMMNIPGVGQAKAKRFGNEFLDVIRRHVELNEIERPTDIKVRIVADKNKVKYQIIQGVDRKINLEDLAESRGLEFIELIQELESIVSSGTRLNIDYYLDEILDEDAQEDIIEYLRDIEEDDLEGALEDLSDEYTEEEVRLARIKFLSSW
ncbi:MAG: RecQ family ATP-dependent DNA helicase, partial [Muribaculaceae bacterium]|nr:RecQ family ATP-dependent DNA helicase [Muribaculaceae bacterium]